MTDTELLKSIHTELVEIRKLLAKQPPPAAQTWGDSQRAQQRAAQGSNDEIPQPSSLIDNPGEIQVHFGKNNGVALANLSERSLAFYAKDPEPRLDSSGKPYPPRPQDVLLRSAARQLWHQQKGTLEGRASASPAPATQLAPKPNPSENLDEDVPF